MVKDSLITTACHLYRKSLPPILPFSLTFALVIGLIQHYAFFLPRNTSFFLGILTLPLLGGWILVIAALSKNKKYYFSFILSLFLEKFISLMATLFSMAFLPIILFIIGFIVTLLLNSIHAALWIILTWKGIIALSLFASLIPSFFAPLLVFTDNLDASTALEKSAILTKGRFKTTFLHGGYATVFFIGLLFFSKALSWLISPHYPVPPAIFHLIEFFLLTLLGPWSFCLWYVQLDAAKTASSSL